MYKIVVKCSRIGGFKDDNQITDRSGSVQNCKSSHNNGGFIISSNAYVEFTDCVAEHNDANGFYVSNSAWGILANCTSKFNGLMGIILNRVVA